MPILSPIGRRRPSVRLLIGAMYAVLLAGALTMVYPFLWMLAGSTKSGVDIKSWQVIPSFLRDSSALYRKHIEALFNESVEALQAVYPTEVSVFEQLEPPKSANLRFVALWHEFLRENRPAPAAFSCGHLACPISRTTPAHLRAFRRFAQKHVGRTIKDANRVWGTEILNWTALFVQPENYLLRVRMPGMTPFDVTFNEFKQSVAADDGYYLIADLYWRQRYLPTLYTRDIREFNRVHNTSFSSYAEIPFPARAPAEGDPLRADWEAFVRHILNVLWIRVGPEAAPAYRRYLQARYANDLFTLNTRYETAFSTFDEIPVPEGAPASGVPLNDWTAWLEGWRDPQTGEEHAAPLDALTCVTVATEFRDYLASRFGTLESLNAHAGTTFSLWTQIIPPQKEAHFLRFVEQRRDIRREFLTRNFVAVLEHIAVHGRGLYNTVIYTSLSVLLALLVNPAAAYALSRFRLRANYGILLFLLLPMAFPPMVTQIPTFLMLRHFHLLNTFAALLLPTMASGYSIFLLKGFFDSLPRELYENAQLDGAGEWTMFWNITIALSKPILAVVALQAFVQAYSNFLYALLICQDERMWTLMVWIYQLQDRSGPGVIYASLLIAAIPMLIIFVLCQRVILRGLVIPVER